MITEKEEEDVQSPNWQGFLWSPSLEFESWSCHLLGVTFSITSSFTHPSPHLPSFASCINSSSHSPTHSSIHPPIYRFIFSFLHLLSAHPPIQFLSPYICAFIYPPSQSSAHSIIHCSNHTKGLLLTLLPTHLSTVHLFGKYEYPAQPSVGHHHSLLSPYETSCT